MNKVYKVKVKENEENNKVNMPSTTQVAHLDDVNVFGVETKVLGSQYK